MSLTRTKTPEVLYGDTTAKIRSYHRLSKRYASQGNAFGAVHAAWAADIHAVQAVIWERVMIASPYPDRQFFNVATTVSKALTHYAMNAIPMPDARAAVLHARAGLGQAFDEPVLRLLDEKYVDLEHLTTVPHPDAAAGEALAAGRLGGYTPHELSALRTQAAADGIATARQLAATGRADEGIQAAYAADMAAFEAYLLDAAIAVGDRWLVTVDLRWTLAYEEISHLVSLPPGFVEAAQVIRDLLLTVVTPIEADRLQERFASLA